MLSAAMPVTSKKEWGRKADAPDADVLCYPVRQPPLDAAEAMGFDIKPFLDARVEKNKSVPNTAAATRKKREDAYLAEARKLF